jgi:hypothetical protein
MVLKVQYFEKILWCVSEVVLPLSHFFVNLHSGLINITSSLLSSNLSSKLEYY